MHRVELGPDIPCLMVILLSHGWDPLSFVESMLRYKRDLKDAMAALTAHSMSARPNTDRTSRTTTGRSRICIQGRAETGTCVVLFPKTLQTDKDRWTAKSELYN